MSYVTFITGAFFATNSLVRDKSYSVQFTLSALSASVCNLAHDIWKTQVIKSLQSNNVDNRKVAVTVTLLQVLQSLTVKEYFKQLSMKSIDLGFNWFLSGLFYDYFTAYMSVSTKEVQSTEA